LGVAKKLNNHDDGSQARACRGTESATMRLLRRSLPLVCLVCQASLAAAQIADTMPPSEPWSPPVAESTLLVPGELPITEETLPMPAATEGAATEAAATGLDPEVFVEEETANWYQPGYWIDPLPWDSGLELGLNGSSGTSESFSIRTGGYIKRESRFSKLDSSLYHNRTNTSGESTQNNAQFDVRNDWLLDEKSPWTLFAASTVFYDEFQAFDVQTNANTGIGYRFIHDPDLGLIGRVGMGTSREFGGPDDRWVPESLLGVEYNQQVAKTQKLFAKVDYFPEWDQVGEFRIVADAGWEIELVQPSNLSLKISANDRYDSTSNGAEPHLVNYSVLLLLKL
jgi:putative salt-induced outer membrane protein YdiY